MVAFPIGKWCRSPRKREDVFPIRSAIPGRFSGALFALVVIFLIGANVRIFAQRGITADDNGRKGTLGPVVSFGHPVRVDVELTLVEVAVTDLRNRFIAGLDQENFLVFEDSVEQEIVRFSSEDVPISIGLILDVSGSMSDKIAKVRVAAIQFFKTANPEDEFSMVTFADRAALTSTFTQNVEELQAQMKLTNGKGRTALLDGVYLALSQLSHAQYGRRALLIISDGGDNHSRYTKDDIKRRVRECDCQLYAIGIFESIWKRSQTLEELDGPSLLAEITEMSGGHVFPVKDLRDLPDIAARIGMELRNQYVLGYRPSNKAHDSRWRKITVKLRPPRGLPSLRVFAKKGYYAPSR